MSNPNQRIDYVRQNIEKFAKKSTALTTKTDKTPLLKIKVNDENKSLNANLKINSNTKLNSNTKNVKSVKNINKNLINKLTNDKTISDGQQQKNCVNGKLNERRLSNDKPTLDRRLSNDKPILDRRLSNDKPILDRRLSNEKPISDRRLSNEKPISDRRLSNDKPIKPKLERKLSNEKSTSTKVNDRRLSGEKLNKINDKQIKGSLAFEKPQLTIYTTDKLAQTKTNLNSRLVHQNKQVISSRNDRQPIKSIDNKYSKTTNDDSNKNRLVIENELLKLKYLNVKCEMKLRKQNQVIIELIKNIYKLIQIKRSNCIKLEKELSLKDTLLFLIELSEQCLQLLKDIDLNKLESYLNLISNIINSALSTFRINELKNGENIIDIFKMTTSNLISDLQTDAIQIFSEKIKQFDLINREVHDTIEQIRNLRINLIDELDKRIKLKNIY